MTVQKPFQLLFCFIVGTRSIRNVLDHLWITVKHEQDIQIIDNKTPKEESVRLEDNVRVTHGGSFGKALNLTGQVIGHDFDEMPIGIVKINRMNNFMILKLKLDPFLSKCFLCG